MSGCWKIVSLLSPNRATNKHPVVRVCVSRHSWTETHLRVNVVLSRFPDTVISEPWAGLRVCGYRAAQKVKIIPLFYSTYIV